MGSELLENQDSEQEFDPFANEKKQNSSGGGGIAWLALVLALALAGLSGWQWWQARGGDDDAALQAQALQEVRAEQQRLEGRLNGLQQRQVAIEKAGLETELGNMQAEIDRIQASVDRAAAEDGLKAQKLAVLETALEDIQTRIADSESALAALAVRGESADKRIGISEVNFLLRTAVERLQLFGDVRGALKALNLADNQLAAIDDPLYLPVRQAIATARLQLDELPRVDTVELTQGLAHLQARIPALPFPGEAVPEPDTASDGATVEGQAGIWERFKATLAGLVTVRRRVDEDELISLADKDYLRQGLWLQLESARLALMRADQDAYQASLARAGATLEQYFDTGAQVVKDSLAAIDGLAGIRLEAPSPDISQPWTTLNRLHNDAGLSPPPGDDTPDSGTETE